MDSLAGHVPFYLGVPCADAPWSGARFGMPEPTTQPLPEAAEPEGYQNFR